MKVAVHATGGQAVLDAIEAGANSIEHAYDISDEALKLMAARKIYLVPTDEPNIPDQQARLLRASLNMFNVLRTVGFVMKDGQIFIDKYSK